MANPKGNPKCVGNKNSGRKSAYEEHNKTKAINLLWEKLRIKIEKNEELTEFEEKLIAPLLSKTIKTETDITSKGEKLNNDYEQLSEQELIKLTRGRAGTSKEGTSKKKT